MFEQSIGHYEMFTIQNQKQKKKHTETNFPPNEESFLFLIFLNEINFVGSCFFVCFWIGKLSIELLSKMSKYVKVFNGRIIYVKLFRFEIYELVMFRF